MTSLTIDTTHLRQVLVANPAATPQQLVDAITTAVAGRTLVAFDPYQACGGELCSGALREAAALLSPLSGPAASLLHAAATALDDIALNGSDVGSGRVLEGVAA